jgi:hypothetical protein
MLEHRPGTNPKGIHGTCALFARCTANDTSVLRADDTLTSLKRNTKPSLSHPGDGEKVESHIRGIENIMENSRFNPSVEMNVHVYVPGTRDW